MDESEGGRGDYGRDPSEQLHRKEVISAVVDEEEDDYEDLYNDVNVGENFLQSMRKEEENLGQRSEEVLENKAAVVTPPGPVVENRSIALQDEGASFRGPGGVEGYQNVGYRGNNDANDIGIGRGMGAPAGGTGLRIELGPSHNKEAELDGRIARNSVPINQEMVQHQQPHGVNMGSHDNVGNMGNVNGTGGNVHGGAGGGTGGGGSGGTILFVSDLHWWTTDAQLEAELCKYGPVKEVKFFEERASGKSKGYCQVEFYDPAAATACKEGMNGHTFNGRPCVVAYASPSTIKRMGEAQVNRNQPQMGQTANQPRRGPGDLASKSGGVGSSIQGSGNHQTGGDNNGRGFGRGNWGRGNSQGGMGNRGPIGTMRGRAGGMAFRGLTGNGNGFGPGIGAVPPLLHPQAMMGQGFDPAFGGPMGRMGSYGGFPGAPGPPFPGMLPSFGPVGMPGLAPHVNPAFFGRGMPLNAMGMLPTPGVEGPNMGMWPDPNVGGWAGEEHGGRAGESSYGEGAASDHEFGEESQDRGPRPDALKEKDRGPEMSSSERRLRDDRETAYDRDLPREKDTGRDHDRSERRHRDDRDAGRDREKGRDRDRERSLDQDRGREREQDRRRDDRDRHADHRRYRNREIEYDDKSSRTHNKSRSSDEDEQRSRRRDADSGKKRRITSD
ncbi:Cleavage and polyadenylation specificity factor subunit [Sesamum angolense]|uniref:Cleavage and polyadenylation specificity factor subunit n=1 Tax=Sesamum angolense TaxID=2727404 RepID=A0AAE2BIT7_9LAMI|nr:Cleavage and polyadenylation specificity factor subunit [Sesamum angolense]